MTTSASATWTRCAAINSLRATIASPIAEAVIVSCLITLIHIAVASSRVAFIMSAATRLPEPPAALPGPSAGRR